MAEPIKISTSKYTKSGKVDVDGNIWEVKLPGAATELRLSQAFRGSKLWAARLEKLDNKLEKGELTDAELDSYEEYKDKYEDNERVIFDFFSEMFQDGSKDNAEVKAWVESTPTAVIQAVFEDMKEQTEARNEQTKIEAADGSKEPSGSTEQP